EGLLSEDIDFMIRLILHCARFDCRAQPYYCYRQARAGSITYGTRAENVRSLLSIIEKWVRLAQTDYRQYERCIYAFLAYEYAVLIGVRGLTPKAKTKEEASENDCLWREIRKLKFLLGHARGARAKTIAFACRIMGLRLTALLASQYIRRRRACGRRR
ncbi:MAG: hypothetical protein LBO81_05960, partial [Clostridiales Family XIII bacterium]|nr:hypothetical protein [Clostridiales Family XIII bacterium]